MCHISKVCIPKTWQCDGVDDCHDINSHDVSDEQNCLACFENEFTCNGTGKCIHTMWKCDGTEDCVDGSDENEEICQSSVTEKTKECDGFSCGQGQCIYSSWVCDFEKDCSNGADEENCEAVRCSNTTEFECSRGSCIPKDWVCDGSHDCLNDKDEENCSSTPPECSVTEFKCRDGFCIHPLLVCDKDLDCPDGSDEDDTLCGDHGVCPEDQWECSESSTCIRLSQHCDGKVDCEEGEDEIGCPARNAEYSSCEHHEFKCDFHACIPDNWVCDKVADCEDESDESPETCKLNTTEPAYEVESTGCSPDQFQCVSGECIDKGYHCDGHADCEDYSDEGHQCKFSEVCSRNNGGCSHICENSNHGPVCSCPEGLKLLNGYICDDLNECEEWGHCSQLCVNTKGSFKCSCRPTFRLEPDGKRCRSEDSSEVMLLFAVKNEIRQTTRDGFMLSILHRLDESSTILDFCYDQIKSMLYVITSDLVSKADKFVFLHLCQIVNINLWLKILNEADLGIPAGMVIFEDTVFWISRNFENLMSANKFSKSDTRFVRYLNKDAKKLKAFHASNQPDDKKPNVTEAITNVKNKANQCKGQVCKNGGTCILFDNLPLCSCPEGFDGDTCEITGKLVKASGFDIEDQHAHKMSLGIGIGISLSIALVVLLGFTYRRKIKDAIRKKRGKDVSILFRNNDFKDTTRLTDVCKPNNIRETVCGMRKTASSKGLLSFNNPLCEVMTNEDLMRDENWPEATNVLSKNDYMSSEKLQTFETDINVFTYMDGDALLHCHCCYSLSIV
ncbi:Very low-density lipoprotein receptor [Nymphon striatum]|nr:Very low-density lipoprotein receptor [Nymphon striatum]